MLYSSLRRLFSGRRNPRKPKCASLRVEQLETRLTPSLTSLVTETGFISVSIDGLGTNDQAGGTIRVQKPTGATVRDAFLAAASTGFSGRVLANGDVKLDGDPVNWIKTTPSSISSSNSWADVTSLVKGKIDGAPAGIVNFHVDEVSTFGIDGEVLTVIFNDPNQTTSNTIILLFGAQNIAGDNFSIGLANPINKNDPKLLLDLSLGISFGFQTPGSLGQHSNVDVNGTRMSSAAGGQDDGQGQNGALLTVGGIGDSDANPADPFYGENGADPKELGFRADDELYDLRPFVKTGDTSILVHTINPSNDDNIFFAALNLHSVTAVEGEGILLAPAVSDLHVGTQATLTATVRDNNGKPIANTNVHFKITEGPDAGLTFNGLTNAQGKVTFTFTGHAAGSDHVSASFEDGERTFVSNVALVNWSGAAPLNLKHTVFWPNRPNLRRPSMNVLGWVILTNNGADINGDYTVSFTLPGVTMLPVGATRAVKTIDSKDGTPFITLSGGLKHGQSVAIYVRFTYPPAYSLDFMRKKLHLDFLLGDEV